MRRQTPSQSCISALPPTKRNLSYFRTTFYQAFVSLMAMGDRRITKTAFVGSRHVTAITAPGTIITWKASSCATVTTGSMHYNRFTNVLFCRLGQIAFHDVDFTAFSPEYLELTFHVQSVQAYGHEKWTKPDCDAHAMRLHQCSRG